MNADKTYTHEDLKTMQAWSLERKIQVAQTRIMEWYIKNDKKCYVSFSGGKDSTVLADLAARVCSVLGCKLVLWFSDTGLEFPEIKNHVKTFGTWIEQQYNVEVETIIDYPKDRKGNRIGFKDVILDKGYPILSKTISRQISDVQKHGENCWAYRCFNGEETGIYNMVKWKFLLDAPFKVSNKCCEIMKKNPAHKFDKLSGLKPIVGTMAIESKQRRTDWLKDGCNSFDAKNPISKPLSVWTEQDVLKYLKDYDIPFASVYGEILVNDDGTYYTTGYSRTGCVFCGFGCHLEDAPNRFQRLKETHPKLWEYCMKPLESGGLGMKDVLNYIGIESE